MRLESQSTTPEVLERMLDLEPALGLLAAPVVVLVTGVVVAWFGYRRELSSPVRRTALFGLRVLAFAVIAGLLAFPTWREVELVRKDREVVVLLDTSRSMALADGAEAGARPRVERAIEALGARDGFVSELAERAIVHVQSFGTDLETLVVLEPEAEDAAADALDEALGGIHAEADSSAILDSLYAAARSVAGGGAAALVLLTDGNDNVSISVPRDIGRLARLGIPVFVLSVGGESFVDLAVTGVEGPRLIFEGDVVTLVASIAQRGVRGETATVRLMRDDETIESREVVLSRSLHRLELRDEEPPAGTVVYRVVVEEHEDERETANNAREHRVQVVDEPVRVLAIEDLPRWEWRFVHNVLQRQERTRGAFYTLLLAGDGRDERAGFLRGFPPQVASLARYDIVIIGDVDLRELEPEQVTALVDYVSDYAGSILFVPGRLHGTAGHQVGELPRLLPYRSAAPGRELAVPFGLEPTVAGDESSVVRLTESSSNRLLWSQLPGQYWLAPVVEHELATTLLRVEPSTHEIGGRPALTWRSFGRGITALLAFDSTWRWRSIGEGRLHERFWGQMVRWLGLPHLIARKRSAELRLSPGEVRVGAEVRVAVEVKLDRRLPEELRCTVEGPDGRSTALVAAATDARPGLYEASLRLDEPGVYRVSVVPPDGGEVLEDEVIVGGPAREEDAVALDRALLTAICEATAGELLALEEASAIVERIDLSPEEVRRSTSSPAWNRWVPLLACLLLVIVEWVLRKSWSLR